MSFLRSYLKNDGTIAHNTSATTHFSTANLLIHFLLKPRLWKLVSVYHQVITCNDYLVLSLYNFYVHAYVKGVTTKWLLHACGMAGTSGI